MYTCVLLCNCANVRVAIYFVDMQICQQEARDLQRELRPQLDSDTSLLLVSIGTAERGKKFADITGFPADCIYANDSGSVYDALKLRKGVGETFFSSSTPFAFLDWIRRNRGIAFLREMVSQWILWQPPETSQAFQQGGTFIFKGSDCTWAHYDPSTAAHPTPSEIAEKLPP
jgi:hypothetical protein